jgi:GNAT superfamily N-acetyltransferase
MLDAQLILRIPGISLLTFDDEQLFRTTFSVHGIQYSHSWLYTLRAAHTDDGKMGFKYTSKDMIAVIGYRHEYVYVTPVFDATGGNELQRLCDALCRILRRPVLVKKILRQDYQQIQFQTVSDQASLPLEDDSYPETILQLDRLFVSPDGTINPLAKKLARRAQSFERAGITFRVIEDIREIPFEKIERFLALDPEKYASYLPIVQYLYTQKPDRYKNRLMIFMHKGRVRGLYMTEVLSLTELGMYGGITSKDIGGITEWMDIYFFRKMFNEGIQTIHLGGSENKGIAEYVGKLLPHRPSYFAQTLRYDPDSRPRPVDVVIRPVLETDITALSLLYRDLYNSLDELGEKWTKESAHKFVSHFYRRQPDLFFLAEHNKHPVGAIVAAIQPWWDGNHLVEGELFIDSAYSATNLNKQLLKELLTRAQIYYQAVSWDTLTPATDKHPLGSYEQIGFKEVPQWAAITGDVSVMLRRLGV